MPPKKQQEGGGSGDSGDEYSSGSSVDSSSSPIKKVTRTFGEFDLFSKKKEEEVPTIAESQVRDTSSAAAEEESDDVDTSGWPAAAIKALEEAQKKVKEAKKEKEEEKKRADKERRQADEALKQAKMEAAEAREEAERNKRYVDLLGFSDEVVVKFLREYLVDEKLEEKYGQLCAQVAAEREEKTKEGKKSEGKESESDGKKSEEGGAAASVSSRGRPLSLSEAGRQSAESTARLKQFDLENRQRGGGAGGGSNRGSSVGSSGCISASKIRINEEFLDINSLKDAEKLLAEAATQQQAAQIVQILKAAQLLLCEVGSVLFLARRQQVQNIPASVVALDERFYFQHLIAIVIKMCIQILGLEKKIRPTLQDFELFSSRWNSSGKADVVFERSTRGDSENTIWMLVTSILALLIEVKKQQQTVLQAARNQLLVYLAALAEGVIDSKKPGWRRMGITTDLFTWVFTMTEENPEEESLASKTKSDKIAKWKIFEESFEFEVLEDESGGFKNIGLETVARMLCLFLNWAVIEGDRSAGIDGIDAVSQLDDTQGGAAPRRPDSDDFDDEAETRENQAQNDQSTSNPQGSATGNNTKKRGMTTNLSALSLDADYVIFREAKRDFAQQLNLAAEKNYASSDFDHMENLSESNSKVLAWLSSNSSFFSSSFTSSPS